MLSEDMQPAPSEQETYSVSQLAQLIKHTLEETFLFVRVRGEVSGIKYHSSGHVYFRLKDGDAVLDAVSWRQMAEKWSFRLEDGMDIICGGRLTTYPGNSRYQLLASTVELAGEGTLLKMIEERKRRLTAEGLFSLSRKKNLPRLPKVIGVITSPTGAVIRDILHRLQDRFPCHVILWPVAVQGEGAAQQMVKAVEGFQRLADYGLPTPDLLILARGGGSVEDLWSFHDEHLVRAVAQSAIPIISAVGHETDITLVDFAADRRAPTPSAAAERAVPVKQDIMLFLQDLGVRLNRSFTTQAHAAQKMTDSLGTRLISIQRVLDDKNMKLLHLTHKHETVIEQQLRNHRYRVDRLHHQLIHPAQLIQQKTYLLSNLRQRLSTFMDRYLHTQESTLALGTKVLETLSYQRVLERGFSIVMAKGKTPVLSVREAQASRWFTIRFHDGSLPAQAMTSSKTPKSKPNHTPGFFDEDV